MEIEVAKRMALRLMHEHGLYSRGWTLHIGRGARLFGACHHSRRCITLSGPLIALNNEAEVRDTILHEIAHALVSQDAGHGPRWKACAIAVGARPQRCAAVSVRQPAKTWIMTCPACGQSGERYRRRRVSCGKCAREFDDRFLLVWTRKPTA
jgi:predicted SprT family Zn-dependent metalloprotease